MKNPPDNIKIDASVGHQIINMLLANYQGPVAVRLWDGKLAVGKPNASCMIIIKNPQILRELILYRNVMRLANDYLKQNIDIDGDTECLFSLTSYIGNLKIPWLTRLHILRLTLKLPRNYKNRTISKTGTGRARQHNSKKSIAHHYDVGNDFYKLWLDREMVYSCAYFTGIEQTLDNAQHDKLDYICRKLRLTPNQTLLDIGCGWGALICWAASHYGVKAHGITLSEQQFTYAQQQISKQGLQDLVTVELLNYNDLPDDAQYDRVVSVGMFEHIGVANFPAYFKTIKRILVPGGLFLNHGITSNNGWQNTPLTRFINSYVFPDGELAKINTVINAMENAGFEVIDVEGLRRHYAMTLRHWVSALEANKEKAISIVGEESYRVWRLYMAGSAYHFDYGNINVYQVLAGHDQEPLAIELRRDELYSKGCECKEEGTLQ